MNTKTPATVPRTSTSTIHVLQLIDDMLHPEQWGHAIPPDLAPHLRSARNGLGYKHDRVYLAGPTSRISDYTVPAFADAAAALRARGWDARRKYIGEHSKMTDRQRMHDGIMNWIRVSDRKPTADDADESGTVWVYDRVFSDVSSVHFYQTGLPCYTHWMPKEKRPAPPAPKGEQQ